MKKKKIYSCDWGTSSFRLRLIDMESNIVMAETMDDEGIAYTNTIFTNQEVVKSRIDFFWSILKNKIDKLNKEEFPILISGMASAAIGMKELPYAELPSSLSTKDLYYEFLNQELNYPKPILLISGMKVENDILRGEETILIGADISENEQLILPGTHSKHAFISNGILTRFDTFMTGEFFSLLAKHSLLKDALALPAASYLDSEAFKNGVLDGFHDSLLQKAFSIRAAHILHHSKPEDNYAYLSGLLIGEELKTAEQDVHLIADQPLSDLYAGAFEITHKEFELRNSSATICFINGHKKIARSLGLLN